MWLQAYNSQHSHLANNSLPETNTLQVRVVFCGQDENWPTWCQPWPTKPSSCPVHSTLQVTPRTSPCPTFSADTRKHAEIIFSAQCSAHHISYMLPVYTKLPCNIFSTEKKLRLTSLLTRPLCQDVTALKAVLRLSLPSVTLNTPINLLCSKRWTRFSIVDPQSLSRKVSFIKKIHK